MCSVARAGGNVLAASNTVLQARTSIELLKPGSSANRGHLVHVLIPRCMHVNRISGVSDQEHSNNHNFPDCRISTDTLMPVNQHGLPSHTLQSRMKVCFLRMLRQWTCDSLRSHAKCDRDCDHHMMDEEARARVQGRCGGSKTRETSISSD